MKIRVEEIKDTEKQATFVEDVAEINEALARTGVVDYQFQKAAPVEVSFYRLGADLLFRGRFTGALTGNVATQLPTMLFEVHRVPAPGVLRKVMLPPWSCTIL